MPPEDSLRQGLMDLKPRNPWAVTASRWFVALSVFVAVSSAPLRAQSPDSPAPSLVSPSRSDGPDEVWQTRSRLAFGIQLGYGLENAIPRNISHINLLIVQPSVAFTVMQFNKPRFPISRFSLVSEGIIGNAVHPGGKLLGQTLLFRFDGKPHRRVVPFFNMGAGVLHTTLDTRAPEISGHTQFLDQAGLGIQYFFRPQRAFVVEYRYFHMSNAGIQPPNHGYNGSMVSLGFRWLLRPTLPGWQHTRSSRNLLHRVFNGK